MAETDETYLTVKEAAEYLNRSVPWLTKDENKATLLDGGAEFGGRGQGSKIPKSLLDNLGWMTEKRERKARTTRPAASTAASGNAKVAAFDEELEGLYKQLADVDEQRTELRKVIKDKEGQRAKIVREAEKEEKAAARAVVREAEKDEKKLRAALEEAAARKAAAEAKLNA